MTKELLAAMRRVPVWAADQSRLEARIAEGGQRRPPSRLARERGVGIIPVDGVLVPRAGVFSGWDGEQSVDEVRAMLREALADETVTSLLLLMDSPGGDVAGVPELAAELRQARDVKPLAAHVRYLAASGAYWLASQAQLITAEPSADVGSIGVFTYHVSFAEQLAQMGVDVTVVREPDGKAEWLPFVALSDDAKAHLSTRIHATYEQFVGAVAAGRGVTADVVRDAYGHGRVVSAPDAKAAGMVDRVVTRDEAIRATSRLRTAAQRVADASRRDRDRLLLA